MQKKDLKTEIDNAIEYWEKIVNMPQQGLNDPRKWPSDTDILGVLYLLKTLEIKIDQKLK